jgi:hypothetical protein
LCWFNLVIREVVKCVKRFVYIGFL